MTYEGHYLTCTDPICGACLPDDASLTAMSLGDVRREFGRRGYTGHIPTRDVKGYLLANADDYRSRSVGARESLT